MSKRKRKANHSTAFTYNQQLRIARIAYLQSIPINKARKVAAQLASASGTPVTNIVGGLLINTENKAFKRGYRQRIADERQKNLRKLRRQ